MKISISRIYVDDQDKALEFYTNKLGFIKKVDISNNGYRWLTVVSPEEENGVELLLESNENPAAKTYQEAMFQQDWAATVFTTEDIKTEHEKLVARGVEFKLEPTDIGPTIMATLNDTCGNLIQINQMKKSTSELEASYE